jgi:hypothetical protein
MMKFDHPLKEDEHACSADKEDELAMPALTPTMIPGSAENKMDDLVTLELTPTAPAPLSVSFSSHCTVIEMSCGTISFEACMKTWRVPTKTTDRHHVLKKETQGRLAPHREKNEKNILTQSFKVPLCDSVPNSGLVQPAGILKRKLCQLSTSGVDTLDFMFLPGAVSAITSLNA